MALETTLQPYEFLARWDQSGNLVGAHVQRRLVTRDNGVVLGEFVTPAEKVALDGNGSFPLADIMSEVQAGAVAQANALAAQIAEMQALLAAANAERDGALAYLQAVTAERDTLAAQIAALEQETT